MNHVGTARDLAELTDVDDPAWPEIEELARSSGATVLPVDPEAGRRTLVALQVTTASSLGAIALNCGGIVADHGWFRLHGGGSEHLVGLAALNGLDGEGPRPAGYLEVGADAVGGRFAVDGGGLGQEPGEVCYFGPDTLAWSGLGGGYTAFVEAALTGRLGDAFAELRWAGWESEVEALDPATGISLYPPPCTEEGQDVDAASRRPVPMTELRELYADLARQLDG